MDKSKRSITKNRSTQKQNQLTYLPMKCRADSQRNGEAYTWLEELLTLKGHRVADGILIRCSDIIEQGGTQWMGTWLTKQRVFYDFAVIVSRSSETLIEIERWEICTPIISAHCKGVGKSNAYLAIELLSEYF